MDLNEISQEKRNYLRSMNCFFVESRGGWVKKSFGRELFLDYDSVRRYDLEWLKARLADYSTIPIRKPHY